MDAQEGALCQTCFVGTLQLAAGILVCDTCGGTQQVYMCIHCNHIINAYCSFDLRGRKWRTLQ